MLHLEQKLYISVLNGALWDKEQVQFRIFKIGLLPAVAICGCTQY